MQARDVVFLRITNPDPHRQKRFRSYALRETCPTDLAASMHAVKGIDAANHAVHIGLDAVGFEHGSEGNSSVCLWSPSKALSLQDLQVSVTEWVATGEMTYNIQRGVPGISPEVVGRVVQ